MEIKIPEEPPWQALEEHLLPCTAYVISFAVIYLAWVGHQQLFDKLEILSPKGHFANAVWTFSVTLTPVLAG